MKLRLKYNAPFTLTFSLVCAIVFLINDLTGGQNGVLTPIISVQSPFNPGSISDYLGIVLHSIGHADWPHLLGNMSFILLLGPTLEEKYGSRDLALMCVITAAATGLMHMLFFSSGLWGASGIVFMFIILISFANVKAGEIPITFLLIVAIFIGKEVMHSFEANQVSEFAHIVGGVFGALFGFVGPARKKTKEMGEAQEPLV